MTRPDRRLGAALKHILAFSLLTASFVSAEEQGTEAPLDLGVLDWMVGSWRATDGPRSAEEHWLPAAGGLMLGLHRDVAGPRRAFFEYLRIEQRDDGIVYVASPGGRPPTEFKLKEVSGSRAVFTNPEHDFPSRIIYWLDAETLRARVEGQSDGKPVSQDFAWPRVASP